MLRLPPDYRREIAPRRVFFTWDITYKCNYRCTYCNFNEPAGWKEPEPTANPGLDKWADIWKKIYARYGSCEIHIAGGEPFVYPGFMDLIEKLSQMHTMEFSTNFHWEPDDFIKRIKPGRARIGVSFHPEFVTFENFFHKVEKLKAAGFEVWVNYVGFPPILNGMHEFKAKFEELGVPMSILPFKGEFEKRKYPEGYAEEERKYLKECAGSDIWTQKTMDFAFTEEKRGSKSRMCRMGQMYAKIHSNGDAFSCCAKSAKKLGNLIDGSFALLEEPLICADQNCPCWKGMVIGNDGFWSEHWVVPPDARQVSDLYSQGKADNVINKLKVALIQAPVWGIYESPVALAQLSACLKQKGLTAEVFDLNIELYSRRSDEYKNSWAIERSAFWANEENVGKFFSDNSDLIEEYTGMISRKEPYVIGFSINVCSLPATIEFAKRIKQMIPSAKVIFGGPMFFMPFDSEGILKHDCVDIIISGEGEDTFCEACKLIFSNQDLSSCKGIYFKKDGRVIKTEERPPIKDLDELPYLDLESFPQDKYEPPGHLGKHISLMTSRGCVLNCAYCGPKAYWPGFRFMSGKRIYDEVKHHLQKYPGIEHIEFLDLELNGNMKSLAEFCDLMIAKPLKKNIKWHANIIIRPEMTRELFLKMRQAGCQRLSVGIETGSQRMLNLMRKGYKIEDAEKALKSAHEAGIQVTTNFMFGFPHETEQDFNLTLEFLRRNAAVIGIVYPSRSYFTIEPFSYVAKHMDEFGIVGNPDNNLYWESKDGSNNYPERLRRCEEFSKLASDLGVSVGLGLQTSVELDRYYNLGFYYESKKDFVKAGHFFREYLKLDPKNTLVNKKLMRFKNNLSQNNTGVSFNWDINAVCNYRCPYCWFYGKWAELKSRCAGLSAPALKDFWSRMYETYGQIKISITGGEPFLYPGFIELISCIANRHKVEIVTNLSCSVETLINEVSVENLRIHPSFHPLFADFQKFVDKFLLLKEKGFSKNTSYVAWPPQIAAIGHYVKKFNDYGIGMFIQPFFGEFKGVRYPDGYTEEERKAIMPYLGERGGRPFETKTFPSKGKLCYAGSLYGVIHPDASVLRCGGLNSADAKLGSISDRNFKLLSEAEPCTSEICPCNEWAFLLKEKQAERTGSLI